MKNDYTIDEIKELAQKQGAPQKWIDEFIQTYDRLMLACEELQESSKDDPLLRWKFPISRIGGA